MIAIYLKTAVILPRQGEGSTCEVIHPPIDRILLTALSKIDGLQSLRKHNWTQLESKAAYFEIVDAIRRTGLPFNWRLEKHWRVNSEPVGSELISRDAAME